MTKFAPSPRNHPFRFSDPVSGRRVRAWFLAPLQDIEDCLASWEILGTNERERSEHDAPMAVAAHSELRVYSEFAQS